MTILELLPNPATLDNDLTPVLNKFTSLVNKGQNFSSSNLQAVLTKGVNLSVPNSFTLVSETFNNLDKIRAKLPSKHGEITAGLEQEFNKILQNGGDLRGLLTPITQFIQKIAPLLEKFESLNNYVTSINQIVSKFSAEGKNLNLANPLEQLEYFSGVLTGFPEIRNVSSFQDLQAQIDTLKVWLSANSATLTQQFQTQIQAFTNGLPTQLNQVMQVGLDAVSQIESPLKELNHSYWLQPYNQVMDELEKINLNNLNNINNYITVLDNQFKIVNPIAINLTKKTQIALDKLEGFDVSSLSNELRYALETILSKINPIIPRIPSEIFQQIQNLVSGSEIGSVQSAIAQLDQQIDYLISKVNFSTFSNKIQTITTQITNTADTLDQGLVSVATFLSNLVNELRDLISRVNLPKMRDQIDTEFKKSTNQVNGLLSSVNVIPQELEKLVVQLKTDIEQIKFNVIQEKITELLRKITSVLNDPQIQYIRTSAQQGIEVIANTLSNVSLKPVFERVLSEIADVKSKLATVDVSQLNELLKKALKLVLDKIREINFAKDVADKLKEEFQTIIDESTDLLKPLQDKYKEIVAQIEEFEPGTWVANKLASPFENLMTELEKIEPSKLLEPLKTLYDSLLEKLDTISPQALLSPLSKVHSQLMDAVRSLSPQDFIKPLNDLLKKVTSLFDKFGIEDLISQIPNTVSKIHALIGNLSLGENLRNNNFLTTFKKLRSQINNLLQDGEVQVNQYLDKLIDLVPAVDMQTLKLALGELQKAIAAIKNQITNPTVLSRLLQIPTAFKIPEFQNGLTNLTKRWLAQKQRFNNITPPPDKVKAYEELKAKLQLLSPIQLLGGAATAVERFTASLSRIQTELTLSQEALSKLLASNLDKLTAFVPQESTATGFKQFLRDALEKQIGLPAKELLQLLKQQFTQLDQVFASLQAIALKFIPNQILTVIPDSINLISQTLLKAKAKITNLNFNFLENELQGVIDEIINQVNSLNPASLLINLETVYKNLLDTLKQLYPEAAIKQLDTTYQDTILQQLKELHPSKTIAKPLDEEYKKIIELQQQLNVDKIFDALTSKLKTLEQELDDGLRQTATAFNQLLQALPL